MPRIIIIIGGRYDDNDHTMIYGVLETQAHEWEKIGKALGFKEGEIAIIKSNPLSLMGAPRTWLREMLNQWLQWGPGDGRGSWNMLPRICFVELLKQLIYLDLLKNFKPKLGQYVNNIVQLLGQ